MSWRKWLKEPRSRAIEPSRDIPYEMPSQRLGPQLASEIAHLFDDAQIPSFLWDWIESSPRTEARYHVEFEFIVPDYLLTEAHKQLVTVGFRTCAAGPACHVYSDFPFKPLATTHFHHLSRVDEMISLRTQSALAAKLHLTLAPPADHNSNPDFMLSNDLRLAGSPAAFAPLPDDMYPFRLLTPVRFAEAIMLQFAHDVDTERDTVVRGYVSRLMFLKRDGQGPSGLLVEGDFHEYLRPLWGALEEATFELLVAHARRVKFQLDKTGFRLPTEEEIEKKKRKREKQRRKEMEKGRVLKYIASPPNSNLNHSPVSQPADYIPYKYFLKVFLSLIRTTQTGHAASYQTTPVVFVNDLIVLLHILNLLKNFNFNANINLIKDPTLKMNHQDPSSSPSRLISLPTELHLMIIKFLIFPDIIHLKLTCTYFNAIIPRLNHAALMEAEETDFAACNYIFACRYCLRLRPRSEFADRMIHRRRGRYGREAGKRFCIECGLQPRAGWPRYGPGAQIIIKGAPYVICLSCREFAIGMRDGDGRVMGECWDCLKKRDKKTEKEKEESVVVMTRRMGRFW
ncbi:hypothetical protein P170DRAFT_430405 [Aspergillus steynii IBT 23096]|uniref:F-box domain-containing protein n=1 Tax=Aspergillus steynii IBT 23096 TaxID=1392250 RepID=A0A2I2FV56_9EURO|nr:uncharacterized protein P170DRAFT_430405 [Aspergillus steynii IBT 23096]PLB44523.1 hypothetical protein P170DRAFT_430405 [Aspergillus steynii IBT 23096]